MGYIDAHFKRAFRLTLKDQAIADAALAGLCPSPTATSTPPCSRRCCSRARSALTDDDIAHLHGLGYARTDEEALELVLSAAYDAAFFLRSTPVEPGAGDRGGRRQHAAEVDVLLPQGPDRAAVQSAAITSRSKSNPIAA